MIGQLKNEYLEALLGKKIPLRFSQSFFYLCEAKANKLYNKC